MILREYRIYLTKRKAATIIELRSEESKKSSSQAKWLMGSAIL